MKVTILSGGSGNDKIVKGLTELYKDCDVKVIINAYDSGKSTGICRKVTNTLGVSDIRKNHSRMYSAMSSIVNKSILEFYNGRYDIDCVEDVLKLLDKWDLGNLSEYAIKFFNRPESSNYNYKSFNIANIIYAEMFSEIGYERTNEFFTNLLGIDDFVILNSFDNVYLNAETESGYVIEDEGDLVDWCNSDDKIIRCTYNGCSSELNKKATDRILESDLIIISTGTFWSSIYPTLHYLDLYKYINLSNARKIWAINNTEDKDSYGVSSNDFIKYLDDLGLDLSKFTIIENLDSIESLHCKNNNYDIVFASMGNENGKHDSKKFVKEIFRAYYNINTYYDKIIFDFDDTIWSRKYKEYAEDRALSIDNIKLLNNIENACVVSGNTYSSIAKKLFEVFGTELEDCNLNIWADVNSKNYFKNRVVAIIKDFIIDDDSKLLITDALNKLHIEYTIDSDIDTANIKIKHLSELERTLLFAYLNDYILSKCNNKYIAKKTGYTTIDIMSVNNNKKAVYDYLGLCDLKTLYIGDEIDSGNDREIAESCTNFIDVKDIKETNFILKLLGD